MWFKVKMARIKLFMGKTYKKAQKLAFAVVLMQLVLVSVYAYIVNSPFMRVFDKKVIYVQNEAKKTTEVKNEAKKDNTRELVDLIHFRESNNGTATNGLHITCKNKGLSNEYGYNPPKCYNDNETLKKIVEDWVIDHKKQGLTDDELLMHYSNGAYGLEIMHK